MDSSATFNPKFLPVWERLHGHGCLWHRTSLPSLEAILCSGTILPNRGERQPTFPQSKNSYARHLGAVSLFDFDTDDEARIREHEWKWHTVLVGRLPASVLIRIPVGSLDRAKLLVPPEISRGDPRLDALPDDIRRMHMVIPAVEALHIGPIPAAAIDGFMLVAIDDDGGYLFREVAPGNDALTDLSEAHAEWNADHDRRTAQRHAEGNYTLAEQLEAALHKAKR